MLEEFWKATGGKVTDRLAAASIPVVIYWLGGLLAWVQSRGGLARLETSAGWLDHQPALAQIVVILAALAAIGTSVVLVQQLTFPVLQLLEGYWPSGPAPLGALHARLVRRVDRRAVADDRRFQELMGRRSSGAANRQELAELIRLDMDCPGFCRDSGSWNSGSGVGPGDHLPFSPVRPPAVGEWAENEGRLQSRPQALDR